MPVYLMRFSYTPETWSRLIQNPEDRRDAARAYIEQVGGTLQGFWYGFGEYDGYAILEAPDNVSMAGVVLAIAGGGALAVGGHDGADVGRGHARGPQEGPGHLVSATRRLGLLATPNRTVTRPCSRSH